MKSLQPLKIQLVFEGFLTHAKGKINRMVFSHKQQLTLKFSWVARVFIDMKLALKEGKLLLMNYCKNGILIDGKAANYQDLGSMKGKLAMKLAYSSYHRFMAEYKDTGDTRLCPSFVFFID